jgi:hypothetical protein
MVSTKISFHTQGPERKRKSTPVHGDAVVDLHDRIYQESIYQIFSSAHIITIKLPKRGNVVNLGCE